MRIGLIINDKKEEAIACAKEIIDELIPVGASITVNEKFSETLSNVDFSVNDKAVISSTDVTITIGGDGTIIHAAKYAAKFEKPLIGVNLGRVGFVAGLERNEISELKSIVKGNYKIKKRMMLDCEFSGKTYVIVNEVTIQRDNYASIIDLEVDINNEKIISYRADGMIFSTPTGSTAYSFSADGPVIDPDMECVLLNPLCPHALSSRKIVFSGDSVIKVRILPRDNEKAFLILDGENFKKLSSDETITIKKSPYYLQLIVLKEKNFYNVLNEKLKEDVN